MELKEITLAQLLNNATGSGYFSTFAKMIGSKEECVYYEGICDDDIDLVEELEDALGYELPSHYLGFLSYMNGGHFLNIDLFSLTTREYPDSLYARNFYSTMREEIELEDNCLIIGKYNNYIMYVECGNADTSYVLMDVRNLEKIEFENFNALIGFIFYVMTMMQNKKIEEEKKQIKEMKDKLHQSIVKQQKKAKQETKKGTDKIRAKAAKSLLKEKEKKSKKR